MIGLACKIYAVARSTMTDISGIRMTKEDLVAFQKKFPKVKLEDLDQLNPWYSCVICKNKSCVDYHTKNAGCPNCTN